jgi:hypothetical protein
VGAGLGPRRGDLDPSPGRGGRAVTLPGAPARTEAGLDAVIAALGELRAAGWPAPEDPGSDEDTDLDGRDHLAGRLPGEVDWLRQCAGWAQAAPSGAATRRRSACARPPAGQTGPSSPPASRGCRRSSTASPPARTNSAPAGRGPGHRGGAPRPAGGAPPAAGRAGPGVPGLLRPHGIARLINPATGAGLGRMAGRATPARRDRPAAGLRRQPVPATLTTRSRARVQETGRRSGAHGSIVTGTPTRPNPCT